MSGSGGGGVAPVFKIQQSFGDLFLSDTVSVMRYFTPAIGVITIELYSYIESTWVLTATLKQQPDADGIATFNVQCIFNAKSQLLFSYPILINTVISSSQSRILPVKIHATYGDGAIIDYFSKTIYGRISDAQHFKESFWDMVSATGNFMTWAPRKKNVRINQNEFLSYINFSSFTNVRLRCIITFTDGSTDEKYWDISTNQYELIEINASYSALAPNTLSVGKTISFYRLVLAEQASPDNYISEFIEYRIDSNYYRNTRQFVFLNSLGGYDVFASTEQFSITPELEYRFGEIYKTSFSGVSKLKLSTKKKLNYSGSTGYISLQMFNYLIDELFPAEFVWEIENELLYPIRITTVKPDPYTDDKFLYQVSFEYERERVMTMEALV